MISLESILEQHNLRTTTPRKKVFDILSQHEKPIFIGQIIKACPEVDRVSIYRTVELFEKLDVIQAFHIGFKKGYELAEPFRRHHHHIHCKTCQEIIPIQSDQLEQTIRQIAKSHDYQLSSHHIELWGICQKCTIKKTVK